MPNGSHSRLFKFLQWVCPDHLYEEIEGDLIQRYLRDEKRFGVRRARRRRFWNVIRFVRPGIIFRHRPVSRANGIPMLYNYLKIGWRGVRKHKMDFIFRLGGLTLALFSSLVIGLYVSFQLSFDKYNDGYERIFRVNSERREEGRTEKYGIVPTAIGPRIAAHVPEAEAVARISINNGGHLRYGDKVVSAGIFHADSALFDVLTFTFLEGDRNALTRPRSMVLTQTIARNLFGDEPALHKVVTMNNDGKLYEITGVIEDMRADSHLRVEGFASLEANDSFSSNTVLSPVDFVDHSAVLYVKLRPHADISAFTFKLESLLDEFVTRKERRQNGFRLFLQPLTEIYRDSTYKYEFTRKGSSLYLYIFSVLGVFLLIAGSINYINLSIATFSGRTREMGVRKVMGAKRVQIGIQIMLETICYCALALLLSVLVLYLFFPGIAALIEPALRFDMLFAKNVIVMVATTVLLLVILSAALPAYWLATGNTAGSLKGLSVNGASHAQLGKGLLVVQFMISIICITATIIIRNQLEYIHTKDLGFDRKNLMVLTMTEDFNVNQMRTLKASLSEIHGVTGVSNSSFRIGGGYWKDWYTVEIDGAQKNVELYEVFSDDQLIQTLGMTVMAGRSFNAGLPADSGAAFVVNEAAVRALGLRDPVGTRIFTHPEEKGKWDGTIVGVVRDINIKSLHSKVEPLVMRLPWQNNYPELFVYIRFTGSPNETMKSVETRYKAMLPGYPIDLHHVDDFYNQNYKREDMAFSSLQFVTIIIVLVAALGIFSLSLYMTVRRRKEFGIRKVLGASVVQITWLQLAHFLKLALLALAIALPIAYALMTAWLDAFAYHTPLELNTFVAVVAVSIFLVIVSAGYASWKSGTMNPVDAIKME